MVRNTWSKENVTKQPCFLFQLQLCPCDKTGINACRREHRNLVGDKEKSDFQKWKAENGNPAMPGKESQMCFLWQRTGSCPMGDKCRWQSSHTPENKPKTIKKVKEKAKRVKARAKESPKEKAKVKENPRAKRGEK